MNIEPMSDGLVRQRRNLLSVSLILIFLKFAGVEVDKLSFLGLEFEKLGNPAALYLAVWVIFFYFLFRYYQYFSQEGKERLLRYYNEELDKNVMLRVRGLADEINSEANFYPEHLLLLKEADWNIRVTYDGGENGSGGRNTEVENIVFPTNELFRHRAVSLKNLVFHTSAATDYILPFIIAFSALIYSMCGAHSGLYEAVKNGFA